MGDQVDIHCHQILPVWVPLLDFFDLFFLQMGWIVLTLGGWPARQRFACVCTILRCRRCQSLRRNSRSLSSGRDDTMVKFNTTQRKSTWRRHETDQWIVTVLLLPDLLPECNRNPAYRFIIREAKIICHLCFDAFFFYFYNHICVLFYLPIQNQADIRGVWGGWRWGGRRAQSIILVQNDHHLGDQYDQCQWL